MSKIAETEGNRIVAKFIPQAWINNYAVRVDCEGDPIWDATEFLLSSFDENMIRLMRDHCYASDELRADPKAPAWIGNWQGPFEVEVEESMLAFFSKIAGRKISLPRDIDDETIAKARAAVGVEGPKPARAASVETPDMSTANAGGSWSPGMSRGFRI